LNTYKTKDGIVKTKGGTIIYPNGEKKKLYPWEKAYYSQLKKHQSSRLMCKEKTIEY